MNGYERIVAALEGKKPDAIPIMLHNFLMAAEEAGVSMRQYREDAHVIADVFIRSVEKYRYDGILVDLDTVTLAGAMGMDVDFPEREAARSSAGCIHSLEDLTDLIPVNIENYKYIQIWLEAVRLIKEQLGNDIFVRGNCDQAPFSLASMLRGTQEWMMDLFIVSEARIWELLDYCTEATCQFIGLMTQTGCDMVSNGDSTAGPEMISPEMYEQFALPYEQKVVDKAHRLKMPYALHICGNTDSILDKMLLTGADAFELDYKTNVDVIHKILKGRATFIGNIDPSGVLAMGTSALVRQKTTELLETYKDPYFILNTGCAIPSNTPEENLRAMIETARSYK